MNTDYRKRAEELILSLGITGEIRIAGEIERLAEAFQQIAQESRREENEACEKIASGIAGNYKDHIDSVRKGAGMVSAAIRSRMIGPETMEEK